MGLGSQREGAVKNTGKRVKLKCAISKNVQTNILHLIMMDTDLSVVDLDSVV